MMFMVNGRFLYSASPIDHSKHFIVQAADSRARSYILYIYSTWFLSARGAGDRTADPLVSGFISLRSHSRSFSTNHGGHFCLWVFFRCKLLNQEMCI